MSNGRSAVTMVTGGGKRGGGVKGGEWGEGVENWKEIR